MYVACAACVCTCVCVCGWVGGCVHSRLCVSVRVRHVPLHLGALRRAAVDAGQLDVGRGAVLEPHLPTAWSIINLTSHNFDHCRQATIVRLTAGD